MTVTSSEPKLHAIGNAHIDPVWLWRWPEGVETIRSTFRSVLDRMNEYPDFSFTGSSAAFYAWLKEVDPAMFAEVRQRVQEGRWEIVGGWWIQPDANIPSGESLVRQALYGQRYFQREFGVIATIGYNPDTFGHTGSLPQILRKAGLSRYVFMRPHPHEKSLPGNVFRWQSADGSWVLTARIPRSYGSWGDELSEAVKGAHADRPDYVRDYMVFFGVGNHGGGPTKRNIDSLHAMSQNPAFPRLGLSTLDAMFTAIESEIANGAVAPVVQDDLQHHARGCYTAESEVKRQNRRLEHLLQNAERMASVAWWQIAKPYPGSELAAAWQAVLFNQFHDIQAGSSLPEAYQDARDGYGYAALIANKTLHLSMQYISNTIDTRGSGDALVIFNPLPWEVHVPIEVERGSAEITDDAGEAVLAQNIQPTTVVGQRRACFVADLPAMGYRLFHQDAAEASADNPLFKAVATQPHDIVPSGHGMLEVTGSTLENDYWRIELDSVSGHMMRLFDKRNQIDALDGPGNVPVVIDDQSDTWSHDVAAFRDEIGRFGAAQIAVEEEGPVRIALCVETHWGKSTIQQRIYLYRDVDIIECRMTVNWQEQMKMLKLSFPLKLTQPRATYDIAYGSIERACNGEEEPGQQWIDVSGVGVTATGEPVGYGLSLLNDCKYGFDVLGSEMRMSVLRSPIYAQHNPHQPETHRKYVYQDQGIQTVTYRLVPHLGAWQDMAISRRAWELNVNPLWVFEYTHAGSLPATASFLQAAPANVVVSVIKKAEDSDALIVRGYESVGKATQVSINMPLAGLSWRAELGAHEIKSWRVTPGAQPRVEEVDLLERAI